MTMETLMDKVRREATVIDAGRRQRLDELKDLLASGRGDFLERAKWREEIIQLHERAYRV